MKTRTKAVVIGAGCLLIAAGSVLGTLAFLTDSDTAVNTFTVGKVAIELNETDVDGDGKTLENEYHLIPGTEYIKDPTVTVKKDSEEAFVRMILTVYNYSTVQDIIADTENGLTDFTDFLGGMDGEKWKLQGSTENSTDNTISYEYRYYQPVTGVGAEKVLEPLFDTLVIPDTLDGDELQALYDGGFQIDVEGHAIQTSGFENNEAGAWEAFSEQTGK